MARILIGVNGDGFGHATRTKPLVEHLQKSHKVQLLAGGKAYDFLSKYFHNSIKIPAMNLVYENNTVNVQKTTINNLLFVLQNSRELQHILKIVRGFKPDVIISDFEIFTLYSSILLGIPSIMTDNQHIMLKTKLHLPIKHWEDYLNAIIVVRFISLHAKYYVIPTFFYPPVKNKSRVFLIPPIIRNEVIRLTPAEENKILVYQTSATNTKLLSVLKALHENFIVYGFNREGKEHNLIFRKFNEKIYFHDLASCKAVITNGGFSLISEALYLGKPILSIPIKNTLEQILNAIYLQKLGYGEHHEALTEEKIVRFLANLDTYTENIRKSYKRDPQAGLMKIDAIIQKILKQKYLHKDIKLIPHSL